MSLIRWQIRSIRAQTFRQRVKGKTQEILVRRRGEVLGKIALRSLFWCIITVVLFLGIHGGISYYQQTVIAKRTFVFTIPQVGGDLIICGIALAVTLLGLLPIEGVFRITNKQGYIGQGLALFLPAAIAFGFFLRWLPSL